MGANGGSFSSPNPTNKRRELMLIAGLIEYPGFGLILFETGCADDIDTVCIYPPIYLRINSSMVIVVDD